MTHFTPIPCSWNLLPERHTNLGVRWIRILESWRNTPYRASQCVKGFGVDCGRWIVSCICELRGVPMVPLPEIPNDAAFHDAKLAHASRKRILELLQPVVDAGTALQPADIVVVGPRGGGPGHTFFVGHQRNTLWNASTPKVDVCGWALPDEYELMHLYRLGELV